MFTKKEVSVLLNGEGGDETFSAYSIYGAYRAKNLYTKFVPKPLRKIIFKNSRSCSNKAWLWIG